MSSAADAATDSNSTAPIEKFGAATTPMPGRSATAFNVSTSLFHPVVPTTTCQPASAYRGKLPWMASGIVKSTATSTSGHAARVSPSPPGFSALSIAPATSQPIRRRAVRPAGPCGRSRRSGFASLVCTSSLVRTITKKKAADRLPDRRLGCTPGIRDAWFRRRARPHHRRGGPAFEGSEPARHTPEYRSLRRAKSTPRRARKARCGPAIEEQCHGLMGLQNRGGHRRSHGAFDGGAHGFGLSFVWHDAENAARFENLAHRHRNGALRNVSDRREPALTHLLPAARVVQPDNEVRRAVSKSAGGVGVFTAVFLSAIGSGVGLYYGRRFADWMVNDVSLRVLTSAHLCTCRGASRGCHGARVGVPRSDGSSRHRSNRTSASRGARRRWIPSRPAIPTRQSPALPRP